RSRDRVDYLQGHAAVAARRNNIVGKSSSSRAVWISGHRIVDRGVKRTEVPHSLRSGGDCGQSRGVLASPCPLVNGEEEQLVFYDRSAQGEPELVLNSLRDLRLGEEDIPRFQAAVGVVLECRSMELVSTGLDR